MEKKDIRYSKYCLVPHCQSSTIRTPTKIFLSLPVGSSAKLQEKRKLWLSAMSRNKTDISKNTRGFVCEDHFNLEEDMESYLRFKLMGGKAYLKDHVIPHIFDCQGKRKKGKTLEDNLLNETAKDERVQQPEDLIRWQDKLTQTGSLSRRSVSVQCSRPSYRSKFVQTDICLGVKDAGW